MESPQTNKIKIVQPNEVPLQRKRPSSQSLCAFPTRIIFELMGLFLIFFFILIFTTKWPGMHKSVHRMVDEKTRLAPGSEGFASWMNPPVKTTRAYRLFNILNAGDIMTKKQQNITLEIEETGPFMYSLTAKKLDPQWSEDNKTLTYGVERIFQRQGEFSDELLNLKGDFVDVPRAMFRTIYNPKPDSSFFILGGYNVFNDSKAVEKIEGFESSVFSIISPKMIGPNTDKYGFIYRYNGSRGFTYTIEHGSKNSSIKGRVVNFTSEYSAFSTSAEKWKTEFFDGLTFPNVGNPPNRRFINVFQPDFCRPLQLRYNRTVSMYGFSEVHEYVLKLVDFEQCPEMDENCTEVDRIDISQCVSATLPNGTLYLTKPHMYGHNATTTAVNVDFKPDRDKHESTIYFDTSSGSPVRAQLRLQLNVRTYIDGIVITKNNRTEFDTKRRSYLRFLPLLWIDQTIVLNRNVSGKLQRVSNMLSRANYLHRSMKLSHSIVFFLIVIGAIVGLELFLWNRRNSKLEAKKKSSDQGEVTPKVQRTGAGITQ